MGNDAGGVSASKAKTAGKIGKQTLWGSTGTPVPKPVNRELAQPLAKTVTPVIPKAAMLPNRFNPTTVEPPALEPAKIPNRFNPTTVTPPDASKVAKLPNSFNPTTVTQQNTTKEIIPSPSQKLKVEPNIQPIAKHIPDIRKTASLHNGVFGSKRMVTDDFLSGFNEDQEEEQRSTSQKKEGSGVSKQRSEPDEYEMEDFDFEENSPEPFSTGESGKSSGSETDALARELANKGLQQVSTETEEPPTDAFLRGFNEDQEDAETGTL